MQSTQQNCITKTFQPLSQENMSSARALVIFDSRVQSLEHLHAALLPHTTSYSVSAQEDAIDSITRLLAVTGAKHLAIVAHGEAGAIALGAHRLDAAHLQQKAALLQEWGVEAISLYSCEVAKGDGIEFIHQWAALTGATISAAAQVVGSTALGGDWQLDVQTGADRATPIFDASVLATYPDVLPTTTFPQPRQYLFSGSGDGFWPKLQLTFTDATTQEISTQDAGWVGATSPTTYTHILHLMI